MKHPAYHLRPNKAVDRFLLIEAIRRLGALGSLREYTYYGLGGPYLEDFRLLYEFCPEIGLVSIEEDEQTFKRQKFHLPCGTLRIARAQMKSFLVQYEPQDMKSIFWLDYTRLEYGNFEDFIALLSKAAEYSMVKITLPAAPNDYFDKQGEEPGSRTERFRREFGAVLPDSSSSPPLEPRDFASLLQEMLQIAAQKALPSVMPLTFQPVSSFYYADGKGMFTLTGVICPREQKGAVKKAFEDWQFANLNWAKPKRIDVPVLSTKERLRLQGQLPCRQYAGRVLRKTLGYLIDDDRKTTEAKLKQYADFHRHYPYFMKAVP